MRAIDLFCGAGGATEGMRRAGLDVVAALDASAVACGAHRRWHPGVSVVCGRVEDTARLLDNTGAPLILWASPSCKPYSVANRTPKRGTAHPEYYPLPHLLGLRAELGARWLIIENVGGLIWSKEGREEVAAFRAAVAARGLVLSTPKRGTISSNTCGVAQLRRRVFLVVGPGHVDLPQGSDWIPPAGTPPLLWEREDPKTAETTVQGPDAERRVRHEARRAGGQAIMACEGSKGSWDAETRWPKVRAAGTVTRAENARARQLLRVERGIDDAALPSRHNHVRSGFGFTSRTAPTVEAGESLGRARTRAVRAVSAGFEGTATGKDPRTLEVNFVGRSLAECCALQGVPLHVVEGMRKRDAHTVVGNAVPPPLAEHVARCVLRANAAMGEKAAE